MAIKNYTSGVDVYTSLGEIQGALAAHGARQIMVEYDDQGRPTGVAFAIDTPNGRRGFMLPANIDGVCQVLQRQKVKADLAQAERTGWRNIRDWVSMDEVFLPYMTDGRGNTLYQLYQGGQLALGEGGQHERVD